MRISFIPYTYSTTFPIMATISHSSSNPLFSIFVTLYTLILLYFPQLFLKLLFSPILISTLVLLLYLLRLGASQQQQCNLNPAEGAHVPRLLITQNGLVPGLEPETEPGPKSESNEVKSVEKDERLEGEVAKTQCIMAEAHSTTDPDPRPEPETCDPGHSVDVDTFATHDQEKEKESFPTLDWSKLEPAIGPKLFLEWDVGAPLEVIYEVHEADEGEEEAGDEAQNDAFWKAGMIKRYPSLSRYYPESDSDSDSNFDSSSSSLSLDEEEREGLIEIAFDSYAYNGDNKRAVNMIMKPKLVAYQKEVDRHFDDEDNLIEIDISPTKNMSAISW